MKKILFFLVIISISLCFFNYNKKPLIVSSTNEKVLKNFIDLDENEIIWANLAGIPPKFIEDGEMQGFGYQEVETIEVRNGLKNQGYKLKMAYMSPSKIAFEIRRKTPICYYPALLKDPLNKVNHNQDKIYSIPLTLTGDEAKKILIKKVNLDKFKKYQNEIGDIDINALIDDTSLKTLFQKGGDLGDLTQKIFMVDKLGDLVITEKYSKHISLMLTSQNDQLIQMLAAQRFDYIISESIEDGDYEKNAIDKNDFMELNYKTSIINDIKDPTLILHSVACSITPKTVKLMPIINKWINSSRGINWFEKKLEYRRTIDKKVPPTLNRHSSVEAKFRGKFESGGADYWYSKQQENIKDLLLFPKENEASFEFPKDINISKQDLSYAFYDFGDTLVYANMANNYIFQSFGYWSYRAMYHLYKEYLHANYIDENIIKHLPDATPINEISVSKRLQNYKNLIILGHYLNENDVDKLKEILKSKMLEKLSIFSLTQGMINKLIPFIGENVRNLNLTSSILQQSKISDFLTRRKWKSLHLSDTQIEINDLVKIIKNLNNDIEYLSLGTLRASWSKQAYKEFSLKKFNQIKFLDLSNNFIIDDEFDYIVYMFKKNTPPIATILLNYNKITSNLLTMLLNIYSKTNSLQRLDISGNIIGQEGISFPKSIKKLHIADCNIKDKNFNLISFPYNLDLLDISMNQITGLDLSKVIKLLNTHVDMLNLKGIELSNLNLKKIKSIKTLILEDTKLNAKSVQTIITNSLKVQNLNLSKNALTGKQLSWIKQFISDDLVRIEMAQNLFNSHSINKLLAIFLNSLRYLNLSLNLDIDYEFLSTHLPASIHELHLDNNFIGDVGAKVLSRKLPRQIRVLSLENTSIGILGIKDIFDSLGSKINIFNYPKFSNRDLVKYFFYKTPNSINSFFVNLEEFNTESFSTIKDLVPTGIRDLSLENYHSQLGFFKLSPYIRSVSFYNDNLSLEQAKDLGRNWPTSCKMIYFERSTTRPQILDYILSTFPRSIEWFPLTFVQLNQKATEKLELPFVHSLNFTKVNIPSRNIGGHLKTIPNASFINLIGMDFSQLEIDNLKNTNIKSIKLSSSTIPISKNAIENLVGNFPKNLTYLDISSIGITYDNINNLIFNLPRSLLELNIIGNQIGQYGINKFLDFAKKREIESKLDFNLIYFK